MACFLLTKLRPFNLLFLKQVVIAMLCHLSSSFNYIIVHAVENAAGKVLMQTKYIDTIMNHLFWTRFLPSLTNILKQEKQKQYENASLI